MSLGILSTASAVGVFLEVYINNCRAGKAGVMAVWSGQHHGRVERAWSEGERERVGGDGRRTGGIIETNLNGNATTQNHHAHTHAHTHTHTHTHTISTYTKHTGSVLHSAFWSAL